MVHENAGKILTDGTVQKHGGHAGIHTARQAENHAVVAQLRLQFRNRRINKRGGTPVLTAATNIDHEILQQKRAQRRMEDFRVELHGENRSPPYGPRGGFITIILDICVPLGGRQGGCVCRKLHVLGRGDALEALRNLRDAVAVAHPHLRTLLETVEKRIFRVHELQVGASVLARVGLLHPSAIGVGNELRSVANAEHGDFPDKLREIDLEGVGVVHREGRPAENHADDALVAHGKLVVRKDFAERVEFADATGNQLRGLAAEVEDDDFLVHLIDLLFKSLPQPLQREGRIVLHILFYVS